MRYRPEQKEEARRKMLEAAGRGFRSRGFAGIGVDGLAKEAGVTSGAFYSHFGSKDAAFELAVGAGLNEVIDAIPKFQAEHGAAWVSAFASYYLGKFHRDDLACGCAMTTLTPEVVRASEEVHALFEEKMTAIAGRIADGLDGGSRKQRVARAWSMLGTLIGGLSLARAMHSEQLTEEVAKSVKDAAIAAAGPAKGKN